MSFTINELLANTANYDKGRKAAIKYIVVHYTANDGDTAENNALYFKNNKVESSANYFVDEKEIYRSVKEEDTAWHCGANVYYHENCRNINSIGIELCSRKNTSGKGSSNYYFKEEVTQNAAALIKDLMEKYKIPIENVIRHYDVTHKICPEPFVKDTNNWVAFKDLLTEKKEITTTDEAIKRLTQLGIIGSPEFWANALKNVKYLDILIIKAANKCKTAKQRDITATSEGINELVKAGVVQNPDFWMHAIVSVKYLDSLIVNMANRV